MPSRGGRSSRQRVTAFYKGSPVALMSVDDAHELVDDGLAKWLWYERHIEVYRSSITLRGASCSISGADRGHQPKTELVPRVARIDSLGRPVIRLERHEIPGEFEPRLSQVQIIAFGREGKIGPETKGRRTPELLALRDQHYAVVQETTRVEGV